MISVEIRVGAWLQNLPRTLATKPIFVENLKRTTGERGKSIMREEAPKRTTALADSIDYEIKDFEIRIVCRSPYAYYVHEGTKPHWIPKKEDKARPMTTPYGVKKRVYHPGARANPFALRTQHRMVYQCPELTLRFIDAWLEL